MLPGHKTSRALLQFDDALRDPVQGRAPACPAICIYMCYKCFKRARAQGLRQQILKLLVPGKGLQ